MVRTAQGFALAILTVLAFCNTTALADQAAPATQPTARAAATRPAGSALDFTVKNIDGKDVSLSRYRGKVVLIVNVASRCGLTKQYAPLEALHEKYADKGLVILGFPANNFGNQEPGTETEIKQFCRAKYDVKFPMFSKISVKGDDKHPLYRFLTSKETNGQFAGEITWNFEKFLVSRDGQVVNRFAPRVTPDSDEVVKAVETQLAMPVAER